jgi:hypothetical protein
MSGPQKKTGLSVFLDFDKLEMTNFFWFGYSVLCMYGELEKCTSLNLVK